MSASQRHDVRVGNRTLSLSNLDKVLWPRDGYTKRDLIDYYQSIAPQAIAHLKGRPLTVQRYPNGIDGATFFEKQVPKGVPDWIERVTVPTPGGTRSEVTFPLCNDEPSLVYFANLAAIVLHVWTSALPDLDEPEFVLFDLDPGEKCTLATLAKVTLTIRDLLASDRSQIAGQDDRRLRSPPRRAAGRRVLVRHREDLCRDRRAPGRCGVQERGDAAAYDR